MSCYLAGGGSVCREAEGTARRRRRGARGVVHRPLRPGAGGDGEPRARCRSDFERVRTGWRTRRRCRRSSCRRRARWTIDPYPTRIAVRCDPHARWRNRATRPARGDRGAEGERAARHGRGRVPDRHEVGAGRERAAVPEVRDLQRRRERAGDVQGREDPRRPAAPRHRRDGARRAHGRGRDTASCTCATSTTPERERLRSRDRAGLRRGVLGRTSSATAGEFDIEMFVSPGGYILGEETALLEALEDKRGEPRNKPPFPGTHGLFGQPTLINNVETFAHVPGDPGSRRRLVEGPGHGRAARG